MELDPTAAQSHEKTYAERLKGNKVLIHTSPMITGEIIEPGDGKTGDAEKKEVISLCHKVWTVDCQTHGQWKASQKESLSETSGDNSQAAIESDVQNGSQEGTTENTSVDDQSISGSQAQESTDNDDTPSTTTVASSDAGHDVSQVQATIQSSTPTVNLTHSTDSSDTNGTMRHDDLDGMKED
ncbi:hypothetical protein EYB26_009820 [Talaromyces marneffei]|uniref:uncharacterized protein n=1 Tax=Talaromyces marneffei TaxID=37727 RepID=UPI0012AA6547|nr:uncharacterized protein EYB26_009820 [Talaromyces marneffei]QGA22106.1 hypothetical protein EYB26_009820 [Talaromyces marneffei]